jgi:hypothetical protein
VRSAEAGHPLNVLPSRGVQSRSKWKI